MASTTFKLFGAEIIIPATIEGERHQNPQQVLHNQHQIFDDHNQVGLLLPPARHNIIPTLSFPDNKVKEASTVAFENKEDTKTLNRQTKGLKNTFCYTSLSSPSQLLPAYLGDFLHGLGFVNHHVKPSLILEKELHQSDINPNLNRLTMPRSKIETNNTFLTEAEETCLDQRDPRSGKLVGKLPLLFVEPSLQIRDMKLSKWLYYDKNKEAVKRGLCNTTTDNRYKKPSYSYALTSKWNEVLNANELKKGDKIQVWMFRLIDGKLGLALVKEVGGGNQPNNDLDDNVPACTAAGVAFGLDNHSNEGNGYNLNGSDHGCSSSRNITSIVVSSPIDSVSSPSGGALYVDEPVMRWSRKRRRGSNKYYC